MKVELGNAMPLVRSAGGNGQGFDALLARMEKELWVNAPGGVARCAGLPAAVMPAETKGGVRPTSDPGSVVVAAATAVPNTVGAAIAPQAAGPVAPAAPAGAGADLTRGHETRPIPASVPAPLLPPARSSVMAAAAADLPASDCSPSRGASPSQQRLFGPSPGRVRLHWHAAGGVTVRLQLPTGDGAAAVVQAMLDHLRSRGVRIHEVTVNGHRYPPIAALERALAD